MFDAADRRVANRQPEGESAMSTATGNQSTTWAPTPIVQYHPGEEKLGVASISIAPRTPTPTSKRSASAVTALVFGIVTLFVSPLSVAAYFPALPALIFGVIAIVRVKHSDGALRGRGMAIAALTLTAIGLVLGSLMFTYVIFHP